LLKPHAFVLDKKDSNSWLMLVLGVGNAKAGALVISGGAKAMTWPCSIYWNT
jgi:hypothetical protein